MKEITKIELVFHKLNNEKNVFFCSIESQVICSFIAEMFAGKLKLFSFLNCAEISKFLSLVLNFEWRGTRTRELKFCTPATHAISCCALFISFSSDTFFCIIIFQFIFHVWSSNSINFTIIIERAKRNEQKFVRVVKTKNAELIKSIFCLIWVWSLFSSCVIISCGGKRQHLWDESVCAHKNFKTRKKTCKDICCWMHSSIRFIFAFNRIQTAFPPDWSFFPFNLPSIDVVRTKKREKNQLFVTLFSFLSG